MDAAKKNKIVMVFGVFDGLHEGHRHFLRAAAQHGERLVVVVARDEMVRMLKQKTPVRNERERMAALASLPHVAHAELGDAELGAYAVIKKHQPDVICLGYDQQALAEDLQNRMAVKKIPLVQIVHLKPHEPEQWHTAILTKYFIKT